MQLTTAIKLNTFKLSLVLGAMAFATGHASADPSLKIFDGFVGYDSMIASKLDEAKSEVELAMTSKATSGDLNNMCVLYILSDEYFAAESACSDAVAKAKRENVSMGTLRTMKSNLKIAVQAIANSSSAAD